MTTMTEMACPKCGGSEFWDNRATKTNPRAPDFKCKTKGCDGAIWPPRAGNGHSAPAPTTKQAVSLGGPLPYEKEVPPADPFPAEAWGAVLGAAFSKYDACLAHAVQAAAKYPTANLDIAAMAATIFIQASRV